MNIKDALKETGKAKRDMWGEKEYVHKEGMSFVDNEGKPFNREDVAEDVWQPYHEVKEIRPEREGELWKNNVGINWFISWVGSSRCKGLHAVSEQGVCFDVKGLDMIHGKNGWTREFPKVEDESVERIEIEGVVFLDYDGNSFNLSFPTSAGGDFSNDTFSQFVGKSPMKMILEIPKETS